MLTFGIVTSLLSGCFTISNTLGSRVSYIGSTPKPKSATSIGPVTGKDCVIQVWVLLTGIPSVTKAFQVLQDKQNVKYLRNVSIIEQSTSHGFYAEHCFLIKGEGFSDET
jgi:hypothetical protein